MSDYNRDLITGLTILLIAVCIIGAAFAVVSGSNDTGIEDNPKYEDCQAGWEFAYAHDQTAGRTREEYLDACVYG